MTPAFEPSAKGFTQSSAARLTGQQCGIISLSEPAIQCPSLGAFARAVQAFDYYERRQRVTPRRRNFKACKT